MSSGPSSQLQHIFFSEFDIKDGVKVVFEIPDAELKEQMCEPYIIAPKSDPRSTAKQRGSAQLYERIIIINFEAKGKLMKLVNFPIWIADDFYERGCYLFSIGLALTRGNTQIYEAFLRKLASKFKALELQTRMVSDRTRRLELKRKLTEIFHQIRYRELCNIDIAGFRISLELPKYLFYKEPQAIHEYDVPVPLQDLFNLDILCEDMVVTRVAEMCDGERYVKRIANKLDADLAPIQLALQNLLHRKLITIIDIFQYSNRYHATSEIYRISMEPAILVAACDYIMGHYSRESVDRLHYLYCNLKRHETLKDFITRNKLQHLDVRKFITFGLINGLIRRIFGYPIIDSAHVKVKCKHAELMDGRHHLDEICVKLNQSKSKFLSKCPEEVTIIYK